MAKTVRIDDVVKGGDGSIEFKVTMGAPPLPLAPSGVGVRFTDTADLIARLKAFEDNLTEQDLLMYLAARWYKSDPTLLQPVLIKAKSMTVDTSGLVQAISFG